MPPSRTVLCRVLWTRAVDGPEYRTVLDAEERARWAALEQPEDRARFVTGRVLAKRAVGRATGLAPEKVRFSRECRHCGEGHGPPSAPGSPVRFSISHSHGLVALAVAEGVDLGVDVERLSTRDHGRLAARVLAAGELVEFEAAGAERGAEVFATYWARKEALLKAVGVGLTSPMRAVTVSGPDERARLVEWRGGPAGDTFALADLRPGPGYAAALAARNAGRIELKECYLRTPSHDW